MPNLKPILDKDAYYMAIKKKIESFLFESVYRKLFEFIKEELGIIIKNSKRTTLIEALRSNKVIYADGFFAGTFNSQMSIQLKSLGAKFVKNKGYKIILAAVPPDIRSALAFGEAKLISQQKQIMGILSETAQRASDSQLVLSFTDQLGKVFKDLNLQFIETVSDDISVSPEISEGTRKILIEKFNENMDIYIKGWEKESIIKLREKVQKHVFEGFRADKLKNLILSEYDVSVKKAKFLALQETSLLVSEFREQRYKDAGVNKYKWSTSGDSRVRDSHKHLNGKIFTWDSPPITNDRGDKNHPGQDWGCRCVPIAIID